jgi:hypothetical protein
VMATSFHPELTDDHRIHGLFVDLVRQRVGTIGHRPDTLPTNSEN